MEMVEAVRAGIGDARLAEYLAEVGGDAERAIELYAWNSRLAAECFADVGHLEILLRNCVDRVCSVYYVEEELRIPWFLQLCSGLNNDDRNSVIGARERICSSRYPESRDRIVASLTFGFWTGLFNKRHDEMWKQCLHMVFAEGNNPSVTRKTVAALLESVRITRNRVAHQNYMKSFDVPKAMSDVFAVADLISPMYGEWMRQHSQWREIYDQCPQIDLDTLIVPGRVAWDIYRYQPIYVCRPGRFFRDMKYLGFYESKSIRSQLPRILRVYDRVEWTEDSAERLVASGDAVDRKLGRAIHWGLSEEGRRVAHGWTGAEEGYKVLVLTSFRENSQGGDGHLLLPHGDIPHEQRNAFVQNHRYVASHDLLVARTTDDLLERR